MQLQTQPSGTVVLWEVLDRLGHDARDSDIADRLMREVIRLDEHLSMVFHRFLEEPDGFRILIGEIPVTPWDPFMKGEKATQMLGEEELEHDGHRVVVRPYVLPHISKMSAEAHRRGAGPRKWADQQGFYVYRNRRLLVAGNWLRLGFIKEEHNKLARIQLDFSNELDFAWDINVRKSLRCPARRPAARPHQDRQEDSGGGPQHLSPSRSHHRPPAHQSGVHVGEEGEA